MVGMGPSVISVRFYLDVYTGRVEIDRIRVNAMKHGKEFYVMSQFVGNYQ